MENSTPQSQQLVAKELFQRDDIKKKFQELLGKRAPQFITSVLQIVSQNKQLAKADSMSIYQSAAVAATLDLPLNNNLGFAYIVPYKHSWRDDDGNWQSKYVAQFQMGYKGFKQLALRSGQFKTIHSTDVREGEIKTRDRLSGHFEFAWIQNENERLIKPVVGYVSFFRLLNGFEQTFYMSIEKLREHGKRYSQSFDNEKGLWKTDFDGMCIKTVIKLNLSKNAPLSIEMQKAVIFDQALVNDADTLDVNYLDNDRDTEPVDKLQERVSLLIEDAKSLEDLQKIAKDVPDELLDKYTVKLDELKASTSNPQ